MFYEHEEERRYRGLTREVIAEPVRGFLGELDRKSLVIEIGSGHCLSAGWHPWLVSIDYSLVALTRLAAGERLLVDAERLPFRDASVDAFLTVAALEHPGAATPLVSSRCSAPYGVVRELRMLRGRPVRFDCRRLDPNLNKYLTSDSDAFTSIDPTLVSRISGLGDTPPRVVGGHFIGSLWGTSRS